MQARKSSLGKLSPRKLWQRKFLAIAPLVVLLPITFLFQLFGGGAGENRPTVQKSGFDTRPPDPHLQDQKDWNKTRYYEKATTDSIAAAEKERAQAIYAKHVLGGPDSVLEALERKGKELDRLLASSGSLSKQITGSGKTRGHEPASRHESVPDHVVGHSYEKLTGVENPDITRLEKMMGLFRKDRGEEDPTIRQLGDVMDKVLRVRYPGQVTDTGRRATLPLLPVPAAPVLSMLGMRATVGGGTGFYGLESGGAEVSDQGLASAIVTDSRQVAKGSPICMQLLTDIRIGMVTIPKGEPIYGVAGSPAGERLPVSISSILYNRQAFPVALQVLGTDGLAGLPIPGSFSREALRESAGQGIGAIEPMSLDPSVGGQAANAGIQVARSLAGRKVRAETARVQAGVIVFLQDIKH